MVIRFPSKLTRSQNITPEKKSDIDQRVRRASAFKISDSSGFDITLDSTATSRGTGEIVGPLLHERLESVVDAITEDPTGKILKLNSINISHRRVGPVVLARLIHPSTVAKSLLTTATRRTDYALPSRLPRVVVYSITEDPTVKKNKK